MLASRPCYVNGTLWPLFFCAAIIIAWLSLLKTGPTHPPLPQLLVLFPALRAVIWCPPPVASCCQASFPRRYPIGLIMHCGTAVSAPLCCQMLISPIEVINQMKPRGAVLSLLHYYWEEKRVLRVGSSKPPSAGSTSPKQATQRSSPLRSRVPNRPSYNNRWKVALSLKRALAYLLLINRDRP